MATDRMRTYTPAEAAERSGFTLDTLRYYEREGILQPIARTSGGRRAYTNIDLDRLDFLRCLRDTGMPVAQLRRYGELANDDSTLAERMALVADHAAAVARSIATLQAQAERLQSKLDWYSEQLGGAAEQLGGAAARA